MSTKAWLSAALVLLLVNLGSARWSQARAAQWYAQYQWGAGFNYIPAYAVNEIEMWESLDMDAIDKQLRWAKQIGFSYLRVFLHLQPYITNPSQFSKNIFKFLAVSKNRGFKVIFVLFDDCWQPTFHGGKQPDPLPGIHNSQWVQCPGSSTEYESKYQSYVKQIISTYGDSQTVLMWDLYNEVGNSGHLTHSLPLLKKIFEWARSVQPQQPLTSGWWNGDGSFATINEYIFNQSDVITFHAYCNVTCTKDAIARMKTHRRPVICTEYMARDTGSKFITHLPLFKQEGVLAINWGFVFGRTQTYYPWWSKPNDPVPKVWFHDVVWPDGTPFDVQQTTFIKNITAISTFGNILMLQ